MSRSTTMSTTTRDRLARLQQLRADCVALAMEESDRCYARQQAAIERGDEQAAWAAGMEAWGVRFDLDAIRARLDKWAERLEADGST